MGQPAVAYSAGELERAPRRYPQEHCVITRSDGITDTAILLNICSDVLRGKRAAADEGRHHSSASNGDEFQRYCEVGRWLSGGVYPASTWKSNRRAWVLL